MAGTNKLLIRGGQVYDHDGDVHHPPVADILIENDRIAAVGPRLATEDNLEIIEASGRLVRDLLPAIDATLKSLLTEKNRW